MQTTSFVGDGLRCYNADAPEIKICPLLRVLFIKGFCREGIVHKFKLYHSHHGKNIYSLITTFYLSNTFRMTPRLYNNMSNCILLFIAVDFLQ